MSLQSPKELLASYEEFRSHLAQNIVEHSWSEDKDPAEEVLQSGQEKQNEEEPSEIKILKSWSQVSESTGQSVEIPNECDSKIQMRLNTVTGEKSYCCSHCDFSCSEPGTLKIHERVHTGEKPHACSQCDFSCSYPSKMKIHMRVHNCEKPYTCTQCDFSCARSDALMRHIKMHTGVDEPA